MSLENKMLDLFGGKSTKPKKIVKTLILDFSNIAWATYFISATQEGNNEKEKFKMWQYYMLNSIRSINVKFRPQEYIIAVDSASWRKSVFKYYKASRDVAKEKSDIDIKELYEGMDEFVQNLKTVFPYRVVKVPNAEADDIIAVLCNELKTERLEITIVSEDKDFQQLLTKPIRLFSNRKKKFIKCPNPHEYRIRHILMGDGSDGIPNFLSDDDTFIDPNKRQKNCGPKTVDKILEYGLEKWVKENKMERNYKRNKILVELSKQTIPNKVWEDIIFEYKRAINVTPESSHRKITEYIASLRIKSFLDKVSDFTI